MMDKFFKLRSTLDCLHDGPLGSYIDAFERYLTEKGYTRLSIKYRLRFVAALSRWLRQRRVGVGDLNEEMTAQFLQYRHRVRRFQRSDAPTLRLLLEYLRESGVLPTPAPKIDDSELGRIEREFTKYLSEERRLSKLTLVNYVPVVRRFLSDRFGTGPVLLERIRPADINRFVLRYSDTLSRGRTNVLVTALRSFFRFLYLRGDIRSDLAAGVHSVASWRSSTLPKWIPQEQVELLLESCDQSTAIGQRDYAILLLLARLGLRSAEVVRMTLDDIDWDAGEIMVGGKGHREDRLPLRQDVGEALARYLRHGRPRCSTRRLFVRMEAPLRGFLGSSAIYSVVRRAFDRAGLQPAQRGPHILRHSLATNMLRNGASLAEIGEVLRHRDPTTTQIYAKVDLEALRKLAQPWPGGEV